MWVVATIGGALIVLPTGAIATTVYAVLTGAEVNHFKPVGLLLWEARNADGAVAENALQEFLRRRRTGKLGDAAAQTVIEAALEQQADIERPWLEDWGEFIEFARVDGLATNEQYGRFGRQSIAFRCEARPTIPSGKPLPIDIVRRETRLGRSSAISGKLHLVSIELDGASILPNDRAPAGYGPAAGADENEVDAFERYVAQLAKFSIWYGVAAGSASRYATAFTPFADDDNDALLLPLPRGIAPGTHELVLGLQLQVEDLNSRSRRGGDAAQDDPWGITYHRLRFEVLPGDTPAVQILPTDAGAEEAIRQSLHPSAIIVPGDKSDRKFVLTLAVQNLPCDLAFDALLRVPGRQLLMGSVVYARTDERRALAAGETPQIVLDGEIGQADLAGAWVLFRPKPEMGESTTNILKAYGGMVTLTDLRIDEQTETGDGSRSLMSVPGLLAPPGGSSP